MGGFREAVGFFLLLCIRGAALWILWPIAFIVWMLRLPYAVARSRQLRLGQVAGWFDRNLIALLERTIARPFTPEPSNFVAWEQAGEIERGPSFLEFE